MPSDQRVPIVRPPDINKVLGGRKRRRRKRAEGDFDDFGSFGEEDFFEEEFDDLEAIMEEDGEVCGHTIVLLYLYANLMLSACVHALHCLSYYHCQYQCSECFCILTTLTNID